MAVFEPVCKPFLVLLLLFCVKHFPFSNFDLEFLVIKRSSSERPETLTVLAASLSPSSLALEVNFGQLELTLVLSADVARFHWKLIFYLQIRGLLPLPANENSLQG